MKTLVIGIGGMTNGGKTTLSQSLQERLPNSCIISQDAFFKDDSVVPVDNQGFKQYDMLEALHMDRMMANINSWQRDPEKFMASSGHKTRCSSSSWRGTDDIFVLIVEGFLIFNYGPLNTLMDKRYFLQIPYQTCKQRRSSRVYKPPDPPGYFDGHVWPMYLKNRKEMEENVHNIVYLDGTQNKDDLLAMVCEDVSAEMKNEEKVEVQ